MTICRYSLANGQHLSCYLGYIIKWLSRTDTIKPIEVIAPTGCSLYFLSSTANPSCTPYDGFVVYNVVAIGIPTFLLEKMAWKFYLHTKTQNPYYGTRNHFGNVQVAGENRYRKHHS